MGGGGSMGGMPPMGGLGGAPPFGMDTGLADLFGLQTGSLTTGGGPVVLPKQVSIIVIIDHELLIIDHDGFRLIIIDL